MKIHRFFIPPHLIKPDRITLPKDLSNQAVKVLRLRRGDQFVALDNSGIEYLVELDTPDSKAVSGKILQQTENKNEPLIKITLYQALLPREKFELALQKSVETGVSKFVPIKTTFTTFGKDYADQKIDRWKAIIREAAEQSERGILPEISEALDFKESVTDATKNGLTLVAHPYDSEKLSVILGSEATPESTVDSGQEPKGVLQNRMTINIFVGPEGGFTDEEIEFAKNSGAKIISIGPRILRSETTGPVLTALILNTIELN